MPIEIRELIIKATIAGSENSGDNRQQSEGGNDNDVSPNEQLINECVELVLQILKEKYGR